ncbi:MAG: hypothetical protein K8F91_18970 [Candidatus Obscuribacterales bacterium]|nr:hypothetical protein [Candidatus Obscuribacterales bacterium]
MFKVLDKLICLFVTLPPVYLAFRFLRWYLKSEILETHEPQETGEPAEQTS